MFPPAEERLISASDTFAREYGELLEKARAANDAAPLRQGSLQETLRFREFKTAGVRGIEGCEIRSVILPLLADRVLREANHCLRLLSGEGEDL